MMLPGLFEDGLCRCPQGIGVAEIAVPGHHLVHQPLGLSASSACCRCTSAPVSRANQTWRAASACQESASHSSRAMTELALEPASQRQRLAISATMQLCHLAE